MAPTARPLAVSNWLLGVAGLVFLMVVVGGITRLTESGLSITEWNPIRGAVPPLTHAQWEEMFRLYQATPQYRQVTGPAGMTLDQFRFIFFWEWVHRLLGRLLGLIFFAGLAWFTAKRAVPKRYGWRLVTLFILGGLQGAIGWFMVLSGLEGSAIEVSPYRLSAHLLMALLLMAALIWTALDLRAVARDPGARPARMTSVSSATLAILVIQLMLGAWVAGFRAGYVANDWPLMQGKFVPDGIDWSQGIGFALTHDPYLLHFLHRWWAWVVVAALVIFARKVKPINSVASRAIHIAFGTQILLGIATVMSGVNIVLAACHQAVGALVVASVTWGANALGRPR